MPIDEFLTDLAIVRLAIERKRKEINMLELSSHITYMNIYDFSQYLTLNNISNKIEYCRDDAGPWEEYVIIFT